jgi:type I restriction enzyme R subunit
VEVRESGPPPLDLSRINFEALASQFRESKQKNLDLEALKAAVRARLDRLVERNRTRVDYSEQFAELIKSYNSGSRSIEDLFDALVKLSQDLGEEQQRHVREHLGEEELVIFDILTRPSPELSPAERDEVKKVARDLLIKVKSLLVTDWRKTTTARARMRLAIEDSLDAGLPDAYTPDVYGKKVAALFEHVYEVYPNRGEGVFGAA